MTALDKAGLVALAETVEALAGPCRETDALIAVAAGRYVREKRGNDRQEWFYPVSGSKYDRAALHYGSTGRLLERYTASLDAAMTLVPERHAVDLMAWHPTFSTRVNLLPLYQDGDRWLHRGDAPIYRGRAATPALALTAAALRAFSAGQP